MKSKEHDYSFVLIQCLSSLQLPPESGIDPLVLPQLEKLEVKKLTLYFSNTNRNSTIEDRNNEILMHRRHQRQGDLSRILSVGQNVVTYIELFDDSLCKTPISLNSQHKFRTIVRRIQIFRINFL